MDQLASDQAERDRALPEGSSSQCEVIGGDLATIAIPRRSTIWTTETGSSAALPVYRRVPYRLPGSPVALSDRDVADDGIVVRRPEVQPARGTPLV